ncbi:Hypothetical protein ORPV_273 [Orpheovirus IHUMI-LCC2]|uniref:Uncharacterized protein n=1 Tax=Orpheovirus IHUMI-LCC2 TaxID=2023057 RepID=A0A2I2L3T5_9VIRU|nr:Hypothetical protein ORPV_273 [Orpheovirus IHUMI-LCC2]SNW62177.1 Hypothetical protein ORPV_273 [Orpheovirus IHUMI-LCC2]
MIPSLRTYERDLQRHFNTRIHSKYPYIFMERHIDPNLVEDNNLLIRVYNNDITYLTYLFDQNTDSITRTKYGFYNEKPETTEYVGMISNMPSGYIVDDMLNIIESELVNNNDEDDKTYGNYIYDFTYLIPKNLLVQDENNLVMIPETFNNIKNYINESLNIETSELIDNDVNDTYKDQIANFLSSIPEDFVVFDKNDVILIPETFTKIKNYINNSLKRKV